MPKITAKPDYNEAQFQRELKRYGFTDQGTSFGTRRFAVSLSEGRFVGQIPGIYAGRFGAFNARLTLKHLQNVAALAGTVSDDMKKNSAPVSKPQRKPRRKSSEPTPLEAAIAGSEEINATT